MMLRSVKKDLVISALLYVIVLLSIYYNISILRPVSAVLFLTIIPGYLLVKILDLTDDPFMLLLYSVGLSLSVLMFLGFIVNSLFTPSTLPLDTFSMVISVGIFSFITMFIYLIKSVSNEVKDNYLQIGAIDTIKLLFIFILPIISIFGGINHNTALNLIMILGIIVLGLCCISLKVIPEKFYPFVILSISLALVMHTVLISPHILGSPDNFNEFYVFRIADNNNYWQNQAMSLSYTLTESLNSMLSITILPAIYSTFLRIDQELFFKLFYPVIFSLTPLVIYKIYEGQTNKKIALFGTLFFITTSISFYALEPLSLSRQMVGLLFLSLCIFLIIDKKIELLKKRFLLVIFSLALTVSHYSLVFIYIGFIILYYGISYLDVYYKNNKEERTLNFGTLLLILLFSFSWFIYVSNSPLNQLLSQFTIIVQKFSLDFFSLQARGFEGSLVSLSPGISSTIVGNIHKYLLYLEHFLIAIGLLILLVKPKKFALSPEFRLVTILFTGALALFLLVPNAAGTLNLTRVYAIIMPFLGLFIVLGGITALNFLKGLFTRPSANDNIGSHMHLAGIISCLIILTFTFQVGLVNHLTNDYPYSYSLDLDRKLASNSRGVLYTTHSLFFLDSEISGAKWLLQNGNSNYNVFSDWNSRTTTLLGYGLVSDSRFISISNTTIFTPHTYVYLKTLNIELDTITLFNSQFNSTVISTELNNSNKIYSNYNSYLYLNP